jgi:hypothetical protein
MEFAVDFITEFDPLTNPIGPDEVEENFIFSVILTLMGELQDTLLADKSNTRPKTLFSNTKSLRTKLSTLINFCLFPEMPHRMCMRLLQVLQNQPACRDILKCLFFYHPDQHRLFISLIRRLVNDSKSEDSNNKIDIDDCRTFYSSLEAWGLVRNA